MNTLEALFNTQQALSVADTSEQAVQTLIEMLCMSIENLSIQVAFPNDEVEEPFTTLAKEAMNQHLPQADSSWRLLAIPMLANDALQGVVLLQKAEAFTQQEVALAIAQAQNAGRSLERIAWPANPLIFRQLVENANVAIDVADIGGSITYANRAAALMYGFKSPEEMIGVNVSQLYAEDEENKVQSQITNDKFIGGGWIGEVRHRHVDGSPFPVELALFGLYDPRRKTGCYGAILQNVEVYHRFLETLKRQTRRLESINRVVTLLSSSLERDRILELASEQIANILNADHVGIALANFQKQSATIVWEYPRGMAGDTEYPLEGNPMYDILQHEGVFVSHNVEEDPRIVEMLPYFRQIDMKSILVVTMSSKDRHIGSISLGALHNPRKFTDDNIETVRILAKQIALAIENSELYSQALIANELKTQFLASMSHELRTPLNSIMGYTEMILSGLYGELGEKQRDRLNRVYTNSQSLLALINDMLDLARIDSGRMTMELGLLDVTPIINAALETVTPRAQNKGLLLETDIPTELPKVLGDEMRIRQVVLNLLSNAVKFTQEGGVKVTVTSLTLTAENLNKLAPKSVQLKEGDWLTISVKDTGIGINPKDHEMIFDAFRQVDGSTSRQFEGTGLGLAIARQLAEMHGGRLWVASELGKGSTFTLALPVKA